MNRGPAVYETAALPLSYVGEKPTIADDFRQAGHRATGTNDGLGPIQRSLREWLSVAVLSGVRAVLGSALAGVGRHNSWPDTAIRSLKPDLGLGPRTMGQRPP